MRLLAGASLVASSPAKCTTFQHACTESRQRYGGQVWSALSTTATGRETKRKRATPPNKQTHTHTPRPAPFRGLERAIKLMNIISLGTGTGVKEISRGLRGRQECRLDTPMGPRLLLELWSRGGSFAMHCKVFSHRIPFAIYSIGFLLV